MSNRAIFGVLLATFLCAGCTPTNGSATINFTQVGACNGWNDGQTLHSAGPNAAYVVFKVHSIDNTQGKVDFNFDPSKMAVNTGSQPHIDSSISLMTFMNKLALAPTTIPQGKLVGLDGFAVAIVQTSNPDGSKEANNTSYNLAYTGNSADPGITFVKLNGSQTSWPNTEDCTTITFQ